MPTAQYAPAASCGCSTSSSRSRRRISLEKRSLEVVADAEERLRAQVPADAAARGIQTEVSVIEESDVSESIRQEAERFGAHLVCIGSYGRSGLAKAVLGSVAQSVMAQSQRPVLIVRKPPP